MGKRSVLPVSDATAVGQAPSRTASQSGPGALPAQDIDRCWPSTTAASGWPAPTSIPACPNGYSHGAHGVQFNPSADCIRNCVRLARSRMQSIKIYGALCNAHGFRTERSGKSATCLLSVVYRTVPSGRVQFHTQFAIGLNGTNPDVRGPWTVSVRSCRYAAARPSSSDSDRTGSSGRPVLIETLADAVPPRPCDAAGLLDEMSGSTRGRRDPSGAVEGVAGPQEREAGISGTIGAVCG